MAQNKSHAVMNQRHESRDGLDDFPTPPWAARALITHVIGSHPLGTCLEPACGRGDMAKALRPSFKRMVASDIHPYGHGAVLDFLAPRKRVSKAPNWIITNPPFNLAEQFVLKALVRASDGVAILARTAFLESGGRYARLFSETPPTIVAQFVERVPMFKGRLDPNGSTATSYCWFVWFPRMIPDRSDTKLVWIPPCREALERPEDYSTPINRRRAK